MGCVSSKFIRKELKQEVAFNNGSHHVINHVVSLTSTTYGALKLDNNEQQQPITTTECVSEISKRLQKSSPPREETEQPEVINAWELMEGLEEDGVPILKKSPKSSPFLRGFKGTDTKSPLKFLNQFGSPKTLKKFDGKENKIQVNRVRGGMRLLDYSPKGILKSSNSCPNTCKSVSNSGFPAKGSPISAKRKSFGSDDGYSSQRRSHSPLFDPELVASYEKELTEEEEQIKIMVWPATNKSRRARKSLDSNSVLEMFEKKSPPGGENSVVIYTTTLRGIRKTFEDCNKVRAIIESHCVHMLERDVSMDSGFKEELRRLMGTKEMKVPIVFVKGRLIGGADEVIKLEDEEKLGVLFEGIPRAIGGGCEGCGGVRFLMCMECNGSCKVLDEKLKKKVRCDQCNENGIIQCPICC